MSRSYGLVPLDPGKNADVEEIAAVRYRPVTLRQLNRPTDPRPERTSAMTAVGVLADAAQLLELWAADHVIRPNPDGWACIRPSHIGQSCSAGWPAWPRPQRTDHPMTETRVPVTVLITVGDLAELITPEHTATDPLRVPSAVIAHDAGLPANELPGRKFTAVQDGDELRDFRLADDPRL